MKTISILLIGLLIGSAALAQFPDDDKTGKWSLHVAYEAAKPGLTKEVVTDKITLYADKTAYLVDKDFKNKRFNPKDARGVNFAITKEALAKWAKFVEERKRPCYVVYRDGKVITVGKFPRDKQSAAFNNNCMTVDGLKKQNITMSMY